MEEENTSWSTNNNNTRPTASKSELISSTKVIIGAAKSAFAHDNEHIDKAQVADAAADLLGATSHYGKLEDKSYGKMINKAEDYLHKYNSSHSTTPATTTMDNAHGKTHGGGDKEGHGGGYGEYVKMAQGIIGHKNDHGDGGVHGHASHQGHESKTNNDMHHGGVGGGSHDHGHSSGGSGGGHGHSGGGGGHDHGHSSGGGGGGGYGEYVKLAQGFLKK